MSPYRYRKIKERAERRNQLIIACGASLVWGAVSMGFFLQLTN